MKHAVKHIHFVGVGGAGMSGIAEVLFNLGYRISGSDLADSATLRRLQGLGIQTCLGHAAAHIEGADAVVTSTAVKGDNPEVIAARQKRIPVVPRALMLAELMRLKQGVAIAGKAGDPVLAAGDGKVVYAGSGLRGFGELVIVKHNATYLSAYAHNRKILVKEGQQVSRGQKIAEMGNTDSDRVLLHFEIRKQGKPVDPARLLPPR